LEEEKNESIPFEIKVEKHDDEDGW